MQHGDRTDWDEVVSLAVIFLVIVGAKLFDAIKYLAIAFAAWYNSRKPNARLR